MWFLEHFIPKLDGDNFKQNMWSSGCQLCRGGLDSALAGLDPAADAAPYRAALLAWDSVLCDGRVGLSRSCCPLRVKPSPAQSASQ